MTKITEIMTSRPLYCIRHDTLQKAAQKMRQGDCGILPVVEEASSMRLVGVIRRASKSRG